MSRKLTSDEWFKRSFAVYSRQLAISLLRERHRLSLFEVMGATPEEVRERQRLYEIDLNRLKEKWAAEDKAFTEEFGDEVRDSGLPGSET